MSHNRNYKVYVLFLSLLLITVASVSGTMTFLTTRTAPVNNTFTPSYVTCEVTEHFDGKVKSNVNVTNTGDTDAYIRVKLVSYRVNDAGQHIGGLAEVPSFTPGIGWVKNGEYYYYTKPVKPTEKPASSLINRIDLKGSYTDADGGKQVIEVMAEAIQSRGVDPNGTKAVVSAWGIDPETLKTGGARN